MSAQTLLDRLVPRVSGGWSRSTGNQSLLKIIEMGQDMLVDEVGEKRIWIGSENQGFPPFLKTVAGTYTYDIIAANLANVTSITRNIGGAEVEVVPELVVRVFVDVTQRLDYLTFPVKLEPMMYYGTNPLSAESTRLCIAQVPATTEPALENTPARVTFAFDPGTHDDYFFCEFLWQAPRMISEFIPLIVPLKFELALEEFVVGYCQAFEHGGVSEYIINFFTKSRPDSESWVTKYKNYMQRGVPSHDRRVIPRVC